MKFKIGDRVRIRKGSAKWNNVLRDYHGVMATVDRVADGLIHANYDGDFGHGQGREDDWELVDRPRSNNEWGEESP